MDPEGNPAYRKKMIKVRNLNRAEKHPGTKVELPLMCGFHIGGSQNFIKTIIL